MMPASNLTTFERHTKTFEDLICSSSLAGGLQQQSVYFTAVHILLSLMAFLGNFLILVVKLKFLYILQAIAFILFNSWFLLRNKWLHYWLEENICSSDLYSASRLYYYYYHFYFYFDSLSSDNIACSRPSYCETKCTENGTIVKAERKKKWDLGRVELRTAFTRRDPTRFDPTPLSPVFFTLSLLSCSVPFAPFYQMNA